MKIDIKAGSGDIPQIIGFARVSSSGTVRLNNNTLKELGLSGKRELFLGDSGEFLLTAAGAGAMIRLENGNSIHLPAGPGARSDALVCFIQRPGALAVKKLEITVEEDDEPGLIDRETAAVVTRTVKTFPGPDMLLNRLERENRGLIHKPTLLGPTLIVN